MISIIIPTYNSSNVLRRCLASIRSTSNAVDIEIIVVDQQSTDDTRDIAEFFGARVISVSRNHEYAPPSHSRNIGAIASTGEYLLHLDSDMTLDPKLLGEIEDMFRSHLEIGALVIPETDKPTGYWSRCKALERSCYRGDSVIEAARVVRKTVFDLVKGYHPKIESGEDIFVSNMYKQVTTIGRVNSSFYHWIPKTSLRSFIRKKYLYGKHFHSYIDESKYKGLDIVGEEMLCYVNNWKRLILNPQVTIGMVILKVSELSAYFIGLISVLFIQ